MRRASISCSAAIVWLALATATATPLASAVANESQLTTATADLTSGFANPPDSDRPWVFWWWLDGAASKEGITRDLDEMRRQGIGGVLLVDAGTGGPDTPKGPPFMSEPWREQFRHAVREAGRLGLLMSVNLCSGWNAGGPWIQPEDAIKHLVSAELTVQGPAKLDQALPQSRVEHNWYRDIAVLACRVQDGKTWTREGLLDLTDKLHEGRLKCDAPEGRWTILRLGYTLDAGKPGFGVSARTKCSSNSESEGWEVDPWSARAMDRHFAATAGKLIEDAGPLTDQTLVQLHIDSWETVQPSWADGFLEEFQKRRGYDARPFLPALARKTVDSAEITARFQWDYRRTAADLFAANHYGRLGELARRHGLGQDSESGGPFFFHSIDGLQCEGLNEVPMGEFWKRTWEPDGPIFGIPEFWGYDTVRQAASAAHIFGRRICAAEAFTSFAEDWIEDPWCLKDVGDAAFCNGLTRMVFHKFTHQPRLDVVPGNQWGHVGTHINANTTWWDMSHAWLRYLRRCQFMLRQGLFVADVAYYYGEDANSFVRSKTMMNPALPPGFDCDTFNAEALLTRAAAKDGRLVLPDGMSYRYLVLPHTNSWKTSPAVLRKIAELVAGGVTVIGPRPALQAPGLTDYPECDREVQRLTERLWGEERSDGVVEQWSDGRQAEDGALAFQHSNTPTLHHSATPALQRSIGKGRVVWGKTMAALLAADGLAPDLEFRGSSPDAKFNWIHRRDGGTDIFFVSNQKAARASAEIAFRTAGRQPELWDAVTGAIRPLPEFREADGRALVPVRFEPRQSFFIVFRQAAGTQPELQRERNFADSFKMAELAGPWEVSFDPKWGGPAKVTFNALVDWTERPEEGIRYYSGTAVYRKTFDLAEFQISDLKCQILLNLGTLKNLASVRLNGRDLGVIWTAPWRVEITGAIQARGNQLEIAVVNLWPNRLIGDAKLPPEKRFTKSNVKTYLGVPLDFSPPGGCKFCEARQKTRELEKSLLPSGLLGPVTIERSVMAVPAR
ncbi:MAG: hypothetical protein HZA90_24195 [Verrucomicrobia bacterium]|nr:hypothetical protein [Verrucomicrobiota bacterium]